MKLTARVNFCDTLMYSAVGFTQSDVTVPAPLGEPPIFYKSDSTFPWKNLRIPRVPPPTTAPPPTIAPTPGQSSPVSAAQRQIPSAILTIITNLTYAVITLLT